MTVRPVPTAPSDPVGLRVISGHDRIRPRRVLAWAFYTLAAVGAFLVLIYLRTEIDESAYRIQQLERRIEFEQARQSQLHLEMIRLESPGEIVPIAEQMLGMVLPEDVLEVTGNPSLAGTVPAALAAEVVSTTGSDLWRE